MKKIWWLNLKQAMRNMSKNGYQTAISLFGLVLGIVCLAYSVNWLWNELNYDSFRKDYKRLYTVQCRINQKSYDAEGKETFYQSFTSCQTGPMYARISAAMPKGTELSIIQGNTYMYEAKKEDGTTLPVSLTIVDTTFAKMVDMPAVLGNPQATLARPNGMVITRDIAVRHFGSPEKAMGASMTVDGEGTSRAYTIGAVVEDSPERMSNLHYKIIISRFEPIESFAGQSEMNHTHNLLVATDHPEDVCRLMQTANAVNPDRQIDIRLVPLRRSHLLDPTSDTQTWPGIADMAKKLVYPIAFFAVSLLLLFSAYFNYLAILTSLYLGRVREYALRICMGASFRQNVSWLLCEVLIMLLLCLLVSGVAMEWMNHLTDIPNAETGSFRSLYICMASFVALVLLGVQYPIWRMKKIYRQRFDNRKPHHTVSKTLLLLQFIACSLFLFVLGTAYRQMYSIFTTNLGFRTENILRIPTYGGNLYSVYDNTFFDIEHRLNNIAPAAIQQALAMQSDLFENRGRSGGMAKNYGVEEEKYKENQLFELTLPYKALDFFNLNVTKGTWFQKPVIPEQMQQVLLNPEAAKALNVRDLQRSKLTFLNPNNGSHLPMPVKGILSFRTHTMHVEQAPYIIFCSPDGKTNFRMQEGHVCIYVKHHPGKEDEARVAIEKVLKEFGVPQEIIRIDRLEDHIRSFYNEERNYLLVFSVISLASVIITLLGVLSMILYTLRMQQRAIAIRRVFGAGFRTLCRHYLKSYLWLVVAGNIIAAPFGAYIMNRWLEQYNVRVGIGLWQLPAIFLFETALVTWIVVAQVRKVMREDPARVLAHE